MPKILHKLAVGGWQHGEDWKSLCLNSNLQYEKPTVSNREEEEQVVTESLPAPEALSDDSESSLEEEEEQNMDIIDLSISVNWWEQLVTIDQHAINLVYDH
ncbi:9604_t:CDS:2, partial [Gigaspora margarita]